MASFLEALRVNRTLQFFILAHVTLEDERIADIIDALSGHARLHTLRVGLRGPESANALAQLLRNDNLSLERLIIYEDSLHIGRLYTLGAAVAANKTLKTVSFLDFTAGADFESFMEGFRDARLDCAVLERIEIDDRLLDMDEGEKERLQSVFTVMTKGRVQLRIYEIEY